MSDILPVPHLPQSAEGYCLPACARMVLAYLGIERSEAEVSQVLGAQEYGTASFAIQRLSVLGVQVKYRQWPLSELMDTLASKQPVIVFVRTGFLEHWVEDVAHAVVIVGVEEGRRFWINDPAGQQGPLAVSWDGLLAAWAEFDYRGAALSLAQ
jgi:ABC-type bacteriocin/lantibiotic exporter with double-glycine peptidase domain